MKWMRLSIVHIRGVGECVRGVEGRTREAERGCAEGRRRETGFRGDEGRGGPKPSGPRNLYRCLTLTSYPQIDDFGGVAHIGLCSSGKEPGRI